MFAVIPFESVVFLRVYVRNYGVTNTRSPWFTPRFYKLLFFFFFFALPLPLANFTPPLNLRPFSVKRLWQAYLHLFNYISNRNVIFDIPPLFQE